MNMKKIIVGIIIAICIISCDNWSDYDYIIVNTTDQTASINLAPIKWKDAVLGDTTIIINAGEKKILASFFIGIAGWFDKVSSNPEEEGVPALWKYINYITIGNDTIPKQRYNNMEVWNFERDGSCGLYTLILKLNSSAE
jgi:hypothetical protein